MKSRNELVFCGDGCHEVSRCVPSADWGQDAAVSITRKDFCGLNGAVVEERMSDV